MPSAASDCRLAGGGASMDDPRAGGAPKEAGGRGKEQREEDEGEPHPTD